MFSITQIKFSNVEKRNHQHNIVKLFLKNNEKIFLNIPKMKCPFGVTKYSNNNMEKYSVNISIEKNSDFYNIINNIDNWVDDNFLENQNWLNILNIENTANKNDIVKYSNHLISETQNFSPYINLKLIFDNNNNNNFFCDIYHHSEKNGRTKINNVNEIQKLLYNKNMYVSSTLIISNIYIQDKKYGITLKPKCLVFYDC